MDNYQPLQCFDNNSALPAAPPPSALNAGPGTSHQPTQATPGVNWRPPKPYRELIYEALLHAAPQHRLTLSEIVGYVTTVYDGCRHHRSQIDSNIRYYLSTDGLLEMKGRAGLRKKSFYHGFNPLIEQLVMQGASLATLKAFDVKATRPKKAAKATSNQKRECHRGVKTDEKMPHAQWQEATTSPPVFNVQCAPANSPVAGTAQWPTASGQTTGIAQWPTDSNPATDFARVQHAGHMPAPPQSSYSPSQFYAPPQSSYSPSSPFYAPPQSSYSPLSPFYAPSQSSYWPSSPFYAPPISHQAPYMSPTIYQVPSHLSAYAAPPPRPACMHEESSVQSHAGDVHQSPDTSQNSHDEQLGM